MYQERLQLICLALQKHKTANGGLFFFHYTLTVRFLFISYSSMNETLGFESSVNLQ